MLCQSLIRPTTQGKYHQFETNKPDSHQSGVLIQIPATGIAKKEKDSNASHVTSGCVVLLGDGNHNNSYESGFVGIINFEEF